MNIVRTFGSRGLFFLEEVGAFSILVVRILKALPLFVKNIPLTTEQMLMMGVASLPLVLFTSVFTGAVSAVQAAYQFQNYVPMRYLGTAVGKAVIIELGPVLTGLVVAGRVSASIAAELGTMKVTEQIDALETMALDPIRFLAVPRFISGIIMLPILTIFANIVAIMGALFVSMLFIDISAYTFLNGVKMFFSLQDVFIGLLKATVFGSIISIVGCFHGFKTSGGAEGVGLSTTRAVVYSCVLILIADYVIASVFFG